MAKEMNSLSMFVLNDEGLTRAQALSRPPDAPLPAQKAKTRRFFSHAGN
jgi:hypothetical protein